MDLVSSRTMDITKLAMDGLMARQKAISANTANVITPNYIRKEVSFEGQLREIVEKGELQDYIKERNSIEYNPTSLDVAMGRENRELTPQEINFLQSNIYKKYQPQITDDLLSGADTTGNNVEIEQEMMDMAANDLRYNTLAKLESKSFKLINSAIRGDMLM